MSLRAIRQLIGLVAACAVVLCVMSSRAPAELEPAQASYQVTRWQLPSTMQPGQRIVGNVSVKVLAPGAETIAQPRFWLVSKSQPQRAFAVPDRQTTPWDWPAKRTAGQVLNVSVTIDVPEDMSPGPAQVLFRVGHGGDESHFAQILDEQGALLGEAARRDVMIDGGAGTDDAAADVSTASDDVPLLVRRIKPPTIDGIVSADEWKDAAVVSEFVENSGSGKPAAQTRARIGYDDANLYVAFECDEPQLPQAARARFQQPRDASVWDNECVELLISPRDDRAGYLHFIIDILNQRYDAIGEDPWGFNPPWQSATKLDNGRWSAELAISFASLGVGPPASGQRWFANLCRERKAVEELSAWRAARGAFASPGTFGSWVFGSLKSYLADTASEFVAPARGWPKELETEAAALGKQFEGWRARLSEAADDMSPEEYRRFSLELAELRRQHAKLQLAAARASGISFAVARGWPYQQFSGEASKLDQPIGPVELTMLRDEWVDLAFNLTNHTDKPIVLRCMTYHGDADEKTAYMRPGIPGLTTLWQQATAVAAGDGRVVHDALVPSQAGTIQLAPAQTTQAWLSLHVPADATASSFAGYFQIKPIDGTAGEPVSAPIRIRVVPIRLTQNPPLHGFTWNFAGEIESNRAWWRAHLEDLAAHGIDTCMISSLNHLPRVQAQPDGSMPDKLDFTRLDRLLDATAGLFRLYWINMDIFEKASIRTDLIGLEFGTPQYERAFKAWLRMVLAHLEKRGIGRERFMINPYDESVDERCRLLARWIKEVDSQIRIVIDSSTPDLAVAREMDAVTDVWVPHYRQFFPAEMQPFHELITRAGKPRWVYWYSEGSAEKGQDPARYYLAKFWWAFDNDVTGIGYWAQQYYGDPWYRKDWAKSYDTALWYPTEGGVLPSRRWQAWRQGWQDYLLLALARQQLRDRNDAAGLATLKDHVRQVVDFPGDPLRAERARKWLKSVLADSPTATRATGVKETAGR
ncbi:glycoside hydrolase domain-containing protein [Fontivita pretiosa]|uniref:glycoside hydrolase domain-containing protein n=1 Tax=Fontivita pretiosa TaxID=2989684 RepID=UPI003D17AEC1